MRELNHVELNSVNGGWAMPSVSGIANYLPGLVTAHPYATIAVTAATLGIVAAAYFGYVNLPVEIKNSAEE